MIRWLICFASLACSALALPASAQCATEAEANAASTCVVMPRAGVRGVWFILEQADTLRREHLEMPELRLQLDRLERMSGIETERAAMYREAAELRLENTTALERQLDEALEREARARAEAGAWYREPVLWFTIGAVIATAVLVAIIAAD